MGEAKRRKLLHAAPRCSFKIVGLRDSSEVNLSDVLLANNKIQNSGVCYGVEISAAGEIFQALAFPSLKGTEIVVGIAAIGFNAKTERKISAQAEKAYLNSVGKIRFAVGLKFKSDYHNGLVNIH